MSIKNISSSLGSFELVDSSDTSASRKEHKSAYDWKPTHWVKFPVPENYDVFSPPWIRPEQVSMSFVGVNIVDVENSTILKSMTVKIKSGKIESISKSAFAHMQEDGWESVNAEGLYLCPGLIDVHTHITAIPGLPAGQISATSDTQTALATTYVLKGMLFRGFTTVRDVGGANRHYKNATEQWLIPGPRIFQGGPMLSQTGGHGDDGPDKAITGCCVSSGSSDSVVVDGVDQCTRAARQIMMSGADHIKICSSGGVASNTDKLDSEQFTVAEIKAICDVVRMMKGTLVTAHCFTSQGARNAIEAGIGGIEHGHLIDDDTLKLMAKKGVHLTPTLIVQELLARPPYQAMIPPASREKLKLVVDGGYKVIKRAHELGVNVAYGTDCFNAMQPAQLSEFDLRAKVLPSDVILKQATVNGAKVLKMEGQIGVIREGAFADLLLLSANPLEDVTILNEPLKYLKGVVKDGRVVRSELRGLRVEVPLV
ncbi:uncharacterized protein IL334_001237 [Kwoniella shivajii]|uniref:Amidohydrolase-related domain-containing protein n=1 Tax=Kwoniella shivajii TaxID=564305 RepID=A0ABZ1CRQ3_9TREE|nr:hypothetical protein IL334_001237 [Kwoniella shivajii]